MNPEILTDTIQNFINANIEKSIPDLAFEKNPFPNVIWADILNQIFCKSKARTKLPTFFNCKNIFYPSKISLEQTSSEKTAAYKSNLVSGKSLIDLTGGFGVDDYYFSKKIINVYHCELNFDLHLIAEHNFRQFQVSNIQFFFGESSDILKSFDSRFDWIYIDPSRRNNVKGKVFLLDDCEPNVPVNLDLYFEKANNILIKTSPMFDIAAGLEQLKFVKEVHIVAVENEVKELLWVLEKDYHCMIAIKTINILESNSQKFQFYFQNQNCFANYSHPKKYLYEPNAAIMKSGAFDAVSVYFDVCKLHQNSQLYTNEILVEFPGRIFEIIENLEYNKNNMTIHLKDKKANLTIRNFSETVAEIRQKWKIKDGGCNYVFFTTDIDHKKRILICKKIG